MIATLNNNRGAALIVTLMMIAGLTIIAGVIVAVTATDKKVGLNESTHMRSFYAADAGGEAAVNWLRIQNSPPGFLDPTKHVYLGSGMQDLGHNHKYDFDVQYVRKRLRPGWSHEYKDFDYTVEAQGESVNKSTSELELRTSRLFKEGY
jgi:hypothetical protein